MHASTTELFDANDLILELCDSIHTVVAAASGVKVNYSSIMQRITQTCLRPDIGTFVMFTGSFSGLVVINFPKDTAMEVYRSYMTHMGMDDRDIAKIYTSDEVANSLGELMNQILGTFTSTLSQKLKIQLKQSQPKMLVLPSEVKLDINLNIDSPLYRKVTFRTESGKVFYVEVAMEETDFSILDGHVAEYESLSPDDILEAINGQRNP